MKIKLFFITLLFIGFTFYVWAQDGQRDSVLLELINEALENNPQIAVAYNEWQASRYKVTQEKSLPDPMVKYTYFGENVETRVGPQERKYGASQKIPFPGKLSLKGKAQSKQAQMLEAKYEGIKREVIKNVKFIFYDIFWVDRAIQVTEEEKAILESIEAVIKKRYEANLTPQQDVLKVQLELSKLIDKLFLLKQNRKSLVAKLNSILNRDENVGLDKINDMEISEFSYSRKDLIDAASSTNPELSEADLNIQRADYEKSLARLAYFPDFTFSVDYIPVASGHTLSPEDGKDAWMLTAAVNVPLWFPKLGAQLKEKELLLEAARKRQENTENNVSYEVEDMFLKIATYRDIISLYETALLPQAKQAFDAAKVGYESAKIDFLSWLDAERVFLQTRLAHYKAIVDYQKSIAYLERVIGKDL